MAYWKTLNSDADARFDAVVELDAAAILPQVTWGTSPEMVLGIDATVPDPEREKDASKRRAPWSGRWAIWACNLAKP